MHVGFFFNKKKYILYVRKVTQQGKGYCSLILLLHGRTFTYRLTRDLNFLPSQLEKNGSYLYGSGVTWWLTFIIILRFFFPPFGCNPLVSDLVQLASDVFSVNRPPCPPPSCTSAAKKQKDVIQTTLTNQLRGRAGESPKKLKWDFSLHFLHTWIKDIGHTGSQSEQDSRKYGTCRAKEEIEVMKMTRSWVSWGQK